MATDPRKSAGAAAGDRLYCDAGHYVCTAAKDIRSGDALSAIDSFKDWDSRMTAPQASAQFGYLCWCGADWIKDWQVNVKPKFKPGRRIAEHLWKLAWEKSRKP